MYACIYNTANCLYPRMQRSESDELKEILIIN